MESGEIDFAVTAAGGAVVRGVYSRGHSDTVPCVVFAHGLGSDRRGEKATSIERECRRREWAFAAFDFRGHGASEGRLSDVLGSSLIDDMDSVRAFVSGRTAGPLFFVGSSMGGWVSAWYAARNPDRVAACALVAPALHFLEWRGLPPEELEAWRKSGRRRLRDGFIDAELGYGLCEEAASFPVEELERSLRAPLLVFHGMCDDVVPFVDSVSFLQRCAAEPAELRLFRSGDHRLNSVKEEIARGSCDFFQRLVPAGLKAG